MRIDSHGIEDKPVLFLGWVPGRDPPPPEVSVDNSSPVRDVPFPKPNKFVGTSSRSGWLTPVSIVRRTRCRRLPARACILVDRINKNEIRRRRINVDAAPISRCLNNYCCFNEKRLAEGRDRGAERQRAPAPLDRIRTAQQRRGRGWNLRNGDSERATHQVETVEQDDQVCGMLGRW